MTTKNFISQVLMVELKSLLNEKDINNFPKYRYHAFILISIGIEFLGAAIDKYGWFSGSKSRKNYIFAITQYKSLQKYNNKKIFENLRCGMAHVYVLNGGVGINMKSEGGLHNKINNGKLLLTIEYFFEDFILACQELIDNIDGNKKTLPISNKVYKDFLYIPQDK